MKIKDVFAVVNTEKNVFLSSYLTRKIQFNDIDPDHIPKDVLLNDVEEQLPPPPPAATPVKTED